MNIHVWILLYLHQTFTDSVSNQYTQYWHMSDMSTCLPMIWYAFWFHCVFWQLKLSTISSQTFINYVFDVDITFWYKKMSNVTASYGVLLDFFFVSGYFCTQLKTINVWCVVSLLHQKFTDCVYLINTHIYWHAWQNHKLRQVL